MVGAMTDISARKEFERNLKNLNSQLENRARQLALSNAELEQFAYVASHDLQEPLRMVTSFMTQLEKKYGEVLDEKAQRYIFFAVDGARRMRQIILGLLEYSRVGKLDEHWQEIDLNELIQDLRQILHRPIEEKQAQIESTILPKIHGYNTPLRQIFQNLITNAIQYSRPDIPPHIKISAQEYPHYWEISVADNGQGIEKEYFDKIFVIFQRLHPQDEQGGTGMGLAIVKKNVEFLGGDIELQSTLGQGATFTIRIPKKTP